MLNSTIYYPSTLTFCWLWCRIRDDLEKAAHQAIMVQLAVAPVPFPSSSGRRPRLLRDDHVGVAVPRGLNAALDLELQQRPVSLLRPRTPRWR